MILLLHHGETRAYGDSIVIEFPGGDAFAVVDCNHHENSNRGFGGERIGKMNPRL